MIDAFRTGARRTVSSVKVRLVVTFVAVLALGAVGSVLVVRQLLVQRLDERISRYLVQESTEVRRLATGNDPETGEPFGTDIERIFAVFLERNIPAPNEAYLTFVGGEPYLRSRRISEYRLDHDPALVSRWADLTRTDRGRADTPDGRVEYLAIPVRAADGPDGTFVVAIFRDRERGEIIPAVAGSAAVGGFVLLLGSIMAWRLANRILQPVAKVHDAARAITETDLRSRIDVEGHDEIARLSTTFNDMLDRLEAAFVSQRNFLNDVSHDLRTPITIIRGHLETMGEDPEDRERTIEIVVEELDRMTRFVSDLLVLARSERPDFLDLATVDVSSFTDDLLAKASALAPRAWSIERSGQGRIVADGQRLTQAMMQLAQNAADHTDESGSITLGSEVVDGWARFWVRDTGPGVSLEEQTRIFERNWHGGGSHGHGLGLSIVRAIAEAHRGTVEVSSRSGSGATFTVSVPVEGLRTEPPSGTEGS